MIGFSIRKWSEKGFQNQSKWNPRWQKFDPRRELKEKPEKYENEQQSCVLGRFRVSTGVEIRRTNRTNGVENDSKSKRNFEADSQMIVVDLGTTL